jgi:hypothetical protein
MTKLLERAIEGLRELPDDMQDRAARQLIHYVDEVTDDGECEDISQRLGSALLLRSKQMKEATG